MIVHTPNHRYDLSRLTVSRAVPVLLSAALLLPLAFVLAPLFVLFRPKRKKNEIVERFKRGELSAHDLFRELEAQQ